MVLDRYILRLWLGPFAGGLAVVLGVLMLARALKLLGEAEAAHAWLLILQLLILTMPFFLLVTVPMAFFLSAQNTIINLQQNSEMDAMRASGVSYTRMLRPLLIAAILIWGGLTYVSMAWMPKSQLDFNNVLLKVYEMKGAISFSPQRFTEGAGSITVYVKGQDKQGVYHGIMLEDRRSETPVFYVAQDAEFLPSANSLQLRMRHGTRLEGQQADQRMLAFDEYVVSLPLESVRFSKQTMSDHVTLMPPAMLWQTMQNRHDAESVAEWNRRLILPTTVLVLFLFALPLSLSPKRSGKAGSLITGIALVVAVYNVELLFQQKVMLGTLPGWTMWATQLAFVLLGVDLWRRAEADRLPKLLTQSGEWFYLLHQLIMQRLSRRAGAGRD
ncbi:MAG TPA: LptF/LptG family permease [Mariprofundaceae bacterium]|nr:LptF/LptG family permease [Mariprofundaceae bacterium]